MADQGREVTKPREEESRKCGWGHAVDGLYPRGEVFPEDASPDLEPARQGLTAIYALPKSCKSENFVRRTRMPVVGSISCCRCSRAPPLRRLPHSPLRIRLDAQQSPRQRNKKRPPAAQPPKSRLRSPFAQPPASAAASARNNTVRTVEQGMERT